MAYDQQPTPHSSASLPLPCLHRLVYPSVCMYIIENTRCVSFWDIIDFSVVWAL